MRVLCIESLFFSDMDGGRHAILEGEVLCAQEVKRPSGRIAIELDTYCCVVPISQACFHLHFVKVSP